ncbi:MAG: peptidoglycan-binding protein [Candidatus Omnitrophica bacterium]|nr:peptidoglycan-binding protein [Candidatus Omnitrophota bacterium]MBU4457804.1 peptidoglycan-binding protein [Candidatus Omnitrophota bacterium]
MKKIICLACLCLFFISGCNIVPKSVQYQKEEEGLIGSTDMANPRVEEIQITLTNLEYDIDVVDGRMGQKTREAIKEFQESRGLKSTGYVDKRTWELIEDIMREADERAVDRTYAVDVRSAYSEKIMVNSDRVPAAVQIQTALKNAGFDPGAIDGKIGPRTQQAVKEFQRAKGLKVDGKVGSRTWGELGKYLE